MNKANALHFENREYHCDVMKEIIESLEKKRSRLVFLDSASSDCFVLVSSDALGLRAFSFRPGARSEAVIRACKFFGKMTKDSKTWSLRVPDLCSQTIQMLFPAAGCCLNSTWLLSTT